MTNIFNEFTDEQLADAMGLRLNGSRWHKIVDPSEVSIDREALLQLARKLVAAQQALGSERKLPKVFNGLLSEQVIKDVNEAVLKTSNTIPRRNRLYEMTRAERYIYDAVQAVEEVGADPLLTDAVVLLNQARDKVADYVDRK